MGEPDVQQLIKELAARARAGGDPRDGRHEGPEAVTEAIAAELQAKGHPISHVGVQGVLRALRAA